MQFHAGGAACDDLRLAYSKIVTEYEVYNEDDFEEMPQVRPSNPLTFAKLQGAVEGEIALFAIHQTRSTAVLFSCGWRVGSDLKVNCI